VLADQQRNQGRKHQGQAGSTAAPVANSMAHPRDGEEAGEAATTATGQPSGVAVAPGVWKGAQRTLNPARPSSAKTSVLFVFFLFFTRKKPCKNPMPVRL
jgi:hypothetical protein